MASTRLTTLAQNADRPSARGNRQPMPMIARGSGLAAEAKVRSSNTNGQQPTSTGAPLLVPKLCLGTHFRETPFRVLWRRETEFPEGGVPNRVWDPGARGRWLVVVGHFQSFVQLFGRQGRQARPRRRHGHALHA